MQDILITLNRKEEQAKLRLKRAAMAMESAEKELADVQAAIRVFSSLGHEKVDRPTSEPSANQDRILSALKVGRSNGLTPKEVTSLLSLTGTEVASDYVRTTLWRMAKAGKAQSGNGSYWLEDVTGERPSPVSPSEKDVRIQQTREPSQPIDSRNLWEDDDTDDDVPF